MNPATLRLTAKTTWPLNAIRSASPVIGFLVRTTGLAESSLQAADASSHDRSRVRSTQRASTYRKGLHVRWTTGGWSDSSSASQEARRSTKSTYHSTAANSFPHRTDCHGRDTRLFERSPRLRLPGSTYRSELFGKSRQTRAVRSFQYSSRSTRLSNFPDSVRGNSARNSNDPRTL